MFTGGARRRDRLLRSIDRPYVKPIRVTVNKDGNTVGLSSILHQGQFFSSLVSTYDCRDQRMQIYGDCAPAESSSERRSRIGGDRGHLGRVTRSSGSCRCALPCRAWCTPMSTRGTMTTARHAPSASSPGPTTEPTSCACVRPQYLRLT